MYSSGPGPYRNKPTCEGDLDIGHDIPAGFQSPTAFHPVEFKGITGEQVQLVLEALADRGYFTEQDPLPNVSGLGMYGLTNTLNPLLEKGVLPEDVLRLRLLQVRQDTKLALGRTSVEKLIELGVYIDPEKPFLSARAGFFNAEYAEPEIEVKMADLPVSEDDGPVSGEVLQVSPDADEDVSAA